MKKKLILIAMCCALAVGATACGAAEKTGDIVSKAGEAASEIINEAGSAVDGAVSDVTSGTTSNTQTATIENADDAIRALQAGNESYLSGTATMNVSESLRTDLATNSRVPPELLFNSGLGELFVIRTAGNVVDEFEIGSVEYAADHLGSPLVLVMGHSHCGAVGAAVEGHAEGNIESIVKEITPSVEKAKEEATSEDEITTKAEDLNVENSIKNLRESEILKGLEDSGKIKIVGAKYDIDTGKVTFFDNTNK